MCVFRRDMTMESVEALSKRALVGCFEYIRHGWAEILDWIQVIWKPLIKSIPRVILVANRWIISQFLSEEERAIIESQFWVIGQVSLVIGCWNVKFDPRLEKVTKRNLWVILSDFLGIVGT